MNIIKRLLVRAAFAPLLLGTLVGAPVGMIALPQAALADKAAPFPIFNDTGKRDRFQHILFLAETAKTDSQRRQAYRNLGSVLQKVGRTQEAYRAYEAGALEGDGQSATIIVEAMRRGTYRPHDPAGMVRIAVLPRAQDGNVSAMMLMAQLLGSGKVKGADLQTSGYWLDKAARRGSGDAQRTLAESAERRGDIGTAATYYAMLDRTGGKLKRALRQARAFYMGKGEKQNIKLGLAWLSYASRIDVQSAGKLAATLARKLPGSDGEERLLELASAAGIEHIGGTVGPSAQLAAATTPEQRATVLADLEKAAQGGSANAALVLFRAKQADGVTGDALVPYIAMAARAGSPRALKAALQVLLTTSTASPLSQSLVDAIRAVAGEDNVDALKALGNLYAAGGPVAPDAAQSLAFFRAAADQGDVESQFRVGLYYAQDTLTADAATLARQYLEAAATQGFAPAKAYLDQLPPAAATAPAPAIPVSPTSGESHA